MFPKQHWDDIREGSSMNFLAEPRRELTPNSAMDEEQIVIAEEFLNELVTLGVLIEVAAGEMVANGPLFCLPKPGQPGQWRILSDMRRGGQNEAIGPDPTVFPKPGVILEQMYTGGWSAVVDASKFFYQFRTRPEERKYLGCIHPRDPTRHFTYASLPMGAAQSPSLAGRYGAAFLRLLRSTSTLFQGIPNHNTWWGDFQGCNHFDPMLGQGRVLLADQNVPAVLVWSRCDDFFLHGPTKDKTTAALTAFLNCAVDVGLLCHPGKLTPPAHAVKYTGFIFDSVSEPMLRIPEYKVAKAIALTDYGRANQRRISRLALAVIVGVLESLVEATPTRIGHTYLRHLQGTLHPEGWVGDDLSYFSYASLSEADVHELDLWSWLLLHNHGRRARATKSGTLVPSFGDGSGTGTGGTVQYREAEPFDMWMGVWSPRVYRFTSNWKEMRTLLATLERAKAQRRQDISGVTFFYFTDNTTTYFAVSSGSSTAPSLHDMVEKIKAIGIGTRHCLGSRACTRHHHYHGRYRRFEPRHLDFGPTRQT